MQNENDILRLLNFLSLPCAKEIFETSKTINVKKDQVILEEGQYVRHIPVVIEGLIKVFSKYEDKELLLYYIQPKETCIMSFSAVLENHPSEIFAVAEQDSTVILLPETHVYPWTKKFPEFNQLIYRQYDKRYSDLLNTINHILFDKLDKRVYDYLLEKKKHTGKNPISISHRIIASELGTAREVVSRIIKKLEGNGYVLQHKNSIEIL